ncbi:CHD5-like domain-containing protein [Trichoderma ceciliae]
MTYAPWLPKAFCPAGKEKPANQLRVTGSSLASQRSSPKFCPCCSLRGSGRLESSSDSPFLMSYFHSAKMPSLMIVVFLVEATVSFINAVGAAKINDLLWTLINLLPISTSKAAGEQRQIQAEYMAVRREMNVTSSQDEFAKWAKLRRKHDKLLEQLETSKKSLDSARSKFDSALNAMRFLLTRAPQYIIPFWYATEPMFWLPHGWFPYYAEWIISFPRAPLGSVSIASWQLACTGIVTLLRDILTLVFEFILGSKQSEAPIQAAGAGDNKDTDTDTTEEKKAS